MPRITCSVGFSSIFKKSLETILDGSEYGRLVIDDTGLSLQSVDSLGICSCVFSFSVVCFSSFLWNEPFLIRIDIRHLYEFAKSVHPSPFVFYLTNGKLILRAYVSVNDSIIPSATTTKTSSTDSTRETFRDFTIQESQDKSCYYSIPSPEELSEFSRFTFSAKEYGRIVLEMSVGCGHTQICLKTGEMSWLTVFDTGRISVELTDIETNNISRTPVENTYITKFLKQSYSMLQVTKSMEGYIQPNGLLLLRFELQYAGAGDAVFSMLLAPSLV